MVGLRRHDISGRRRWRAAWLAAAVLVALPGLANADHDRRDHDGRPWRGDDIRHFDRGDAHVWRGGRWHHGYHDGRLGWWWIVGTLWYFYPQPVYPYPDPYVPPVVVVPPTAVPTPAPTQYWYYCDPRRAYYPYVQSCPVPWRLVPATPGP